MGLPEFAWMGEKTAGLARANCSTKEHLGAIDFSARRSVCCLESRILRLDNN